MIKLKVGTEDVVLDPDHLRFSESNLNEYLQNFASWYSHYYTIHARAQLVNSMYEDRYEQVYSERFNNYKDKVSDNLAKARATADEATKDALLKVRKSKENVQVLWGWLRSMDKAHESALNFGYNLRKEMDKIAGNTIYNKTEDKNLEDILGIKE